ncbi:hypothetical protein RIF29_04346 [Crotalaria pallida]|uniref:Uncharacterized protein n=1 Tax=Crotalaria pallida TaxID=3830 RepID=A0AAN9J149_CROPI
MARQNGAGAQLVPQRCAWAHGRTHLGCYKESKNSSRENKEIPEIDPSAINANEIVMEKSFGPWILVKRIPSSKDRGVQKGGNNKIDSGYRKNQSLSDEPSNVFGSRFNALVEEEKGDLVVGNIAHDICTLHEGKSKEIIEVNEVGTVGGKKEVIRDTKVRDSSRDKNPQIRGPKGVVCPIKNKSGHGEASKATSSSVMTSTKKIQSMQTRTDSVQARKADSGKEKEILARMKVLEKEGEGILNRFATKVYLPCKEAIALVHIQNDSIEKAVPLDILTNTIQHATRMEEDSALVLEDNSNDGKPIPGNSGSKNPTTSFSS